jgi:RND family efflux transporter MFP subunit
MNHSSPSIIALLALLHATGACSEPPHLPDPPRPVRTVRIEPMSGGETLVQTGEVQPRRETDLAFQIDGRVTRRLVDVGRALAAGDLVAQIDGDVVKNELRAAKADLANASSSLELAQASLARLQELYDSQSASAQQLDEARANQRAATARREVAAQALSSVEKKLAYTRLAAPESGVVTAVNANVGQIVAAGQSVVRLASRERDAVFAVADHVISSAPPNARVRVQLASDPAISAVGSVREVSPSADPVTRTFSVRIAIDDAPAELAYGAPVTGTLEYSAGTVISVPDSALTSESGAPAVLIVTPDRKLERRRVQVLRYEDGRVLLAAGPRSGELVVTAGVSKLRPGQQIALMSENEGAR